MKTAISLPDSVFEEAESVAQRLGMSRSELYTKALLEYIKKYDKEQTLAQLNEVYSKEDSRLDPRLAEMQFSIVTHEDW